MSVLVPSFATNNNTHHHHHHHHHHTAYFSNNTNRRINGNLPPIQQNRFSMNALNDHEQENDQVPFGVVNSMKRRLLDKVNESLVLNNNSTIVRNTLTKQSTRIGSNENLLQTKLSTSSLQRTTRLSRSQDNLTNNHHSSGHSFPTEQFTSYIQPKQDVIIVDTTKNSNHNEDFYDDEKLRTAQKNLPHRQSYTELHIDEAPKPGTVTTVKNMFERQIRLSRYDADKIVNTSVSGCPRLNNNHHRDLSSPTRSRSISPNDMALRQRRTPASGPVLSLTVASSYPDLVISHTPPAETTKTSIESNHNENHLPNNQTVNKEKKLSNTNRTISSQDHAPLSVIVDEYSTNQSNNSRPNLLLPSKSVTETVDCQPLDFKSRLALFNRTNSQRTNDNSLNTKKCLTQTNSSSTNILSKPVVHHHNNRALNDEKKDNQTELIHPSLAIPISRSVINIAKAVTFYGGNKLNGTSKSSLPDTIAPPPPPAPSSTSIQFEMNIKDGQTNQSNSIDPLHAPDVIGGNVKLSKSSIFSGTKKNTRVQFLDDVDTFEYPSFEILMADYVNEESDDENDMEIDDDLPNVTSNISNNNTDNENHNGLKSYTMEKKIENNDDQLIDTNNNIDDVDDDELERLARINAEYNTNNLSEKPLKPKGTLHTFRPTHLDQYELGSQHGSQITSKSSDINSSANPYTILSRQKFSTSADTSTKLLSNHSILKQRPTFDTANTIQWSSMSTTTDLLF